MTAPAYIQGSSSPYRPDTRHSLENLPNQDSRSTTSDLLFSSLQVAAASARRCAVLLHASTTSSEVLGSEFLLMRFLPRFELLHFGSAFRRPDKRTNRTRTRRLNFALASAHSSRKLPMPDRARRSLAELTPKSDHGHRSEESQCPVGPCRGLLGPR